MVIRSVAPRERLSDHLTQMILAKAEGSPFFLEELTWAVVEQEELQGEVAVPDTIQGVLMGGVGVSHQAINEALRIDMQHLPTVLRRYVTEVWNKYIVTDDQQCNDTMYLVQSPRPPGSDAEQYYGGCLVPRPRRL